MANSFAMFSNRRRIGLIVLSVLLVILLSFFIYLWSGLPDFTELENVNPAQVTRIYSSDNEVIHELYRHNRIWIPYDKIPAHAIDLLIATEDREFYSHWGVNIWGIPRAVLVNLKEMEFSQGFSTITMQVARNVYAKIGFERSIVRKLREILTAVQLERTYSKKEILEMYYNTVYFGRGSYGVQSASKRYFNKDASELTTEESAYLVGILRSPSRYDPERNPDGAEHIRNVALYNLVVTNSMTQSLYDSLKQIPLISEQWEDRSTSAPYFTEYVRTQLNDLQKELNIDVYEDGLNVYTTLDSRFQMAMDSSIRKHLPTLQERVTENLKKGREEEEYTDSSFIEKSLVQIGFVALDHRTGHIKALVGGRDFDKYKFNRAIQAKRQPGSTFKLFLYTAAMDNGYTPVDKLLNQPVVVPNQDGSRWTPENFDRKFGGQTTLREGLRKSLNLVSARLILDLGPEAVVKYARDLGITTRLRPFYSMAMGSFEVIPLEMVGAFGTIANQGVKVEPISILRIEDRHGNIIYQNKPRHTQVLNNATAYIMTDLLADVVDGGTGGSIRWRYNWGAPAAGKTGTTNDYADAWFVGFTPYVTAGVWVGLDSPELKLGRGNSGDRAALPFWADFMKLIYEDEELSLRSEAFQQPAGVVKKTVCEESGELTTNFCPTVVKDEVFHVEYAPTQQCELHRGYRF